MLAYSTIAHVGLFLIAFGLMEHVSMAGAVIYVVSHGAINHFGIRLVARLNDLSVAVHVVGVLAIVGALAFFAPKQPLAFFFVPITSNPAGWPYWWAFVVGLLQAQWTFTGYDASASVSEETVDPRRRVPWGIVMAVVPRFNPPVARGGTARLPVRRMSPGSKIGFGDR